LPITPSPNNAEGFSGPQKPARRLLLYGKILPALDRHCGSDLREEDLFARFDRTKPVFSD